MLEIFCFNCHWNDMVFFFCEYDGNVFEIVSIVSRMMFSPVNGIVGARIVCFTSQCDQPSVFLLIVLP